VVNISDSLIYGNMFSVIGNQLDWWSRLPDCVSVPRGGQRRRRYHYGFFGRHPKRYVNTDLKKNTEFSLSLSF